MPRIPRKLLVDPTEVGVFHCVSRCVRRAFLCGEDPLTGRNFDHRKHWLQQRIAFLAGQFGIDVLGFAVMSNHLHVILRNRPDVVRDWSDEEVARRWWNLFPLRRDDHGNPAAPEEWELALVTGNPGRLAEVRRQLSSLSWFMRCVAEPIARRANCEDECTGRFWEGGDKRAIHLQRWTTNERSLRKLSDFPDCRPKLGGPSRFARWSGTRESGQCCCPSFS